MSPEYTLAGPDCGLLFLDTLLLVGLWFRLGPDGRECRRGSGTGTGSATPDCGALRRCDAGSPVAGGALDAVFASLWHPWTAVSIG